MVNLYNLFTFKKICFVLAPCGRRGFIRRNQPWPLVGEDLVVLADGIRSAVRVLVRTKRNEKRRTLHPVNEFSITDAVGHEESTNGRRFLIEALSIFL